MILSFVTDEQNFIKILCIVLALALFTTMLIFRSEVKKTAKMFNMADCYIYYKEMEISWNPLLNISESAGG